jgi:hypothetical protein
LLWDELRQSTPRHILTTLDHSAMPDLDPRLNEADVQKVIARALELQAAQAQGTTIAEIREIASELAIPEAAIDQAVSEYRAGDVSTPRTDRRTTPDFSARSRIGRRLMMSIGVLGGALFLLIVLSIIVRL